MQSSHESDGTKKRRAPITIRSATTGSYPPSHICVDMYGTCEEDEKCDCHKPLIINHPDNHDLPR